MQYRHLWLAGLLAQAGAVQAMGLGDMALRSHLGAPLQAELNLFSPGQYDQEDIRVRIARLDVYDRLGAHYEPFHSQIEFDVRRDASGQLQVLARSRKRLTEPFLDIVVELSWPSGSTYRRYNLLVDPPEYALRWQSPRSNQAQPVEAASVQLARRVTAPVTRSTPAQATAKPAPGSSVTIGAAYVVKQGDSLWKIARQLGGQGSHSVHALMQELYAANPDAFVRGDRDRLKLGATLRLPLPADATSQQLLAQSAPAQNSSPRSNPVPQTAATTAAPATSVDIQAELTQAQQAQHAAVPEDVAGIQAAIAQLQREKQELQQFQQQLKAEMTEVLEQRIAATEALLQMEQLQRQMQTSGSTLTGAVERVPEKAPTQAATSATVANTDTTNSAPTLTDSISLLADPAPRALSDVRFRDLMAVAEPPSPGTLDMTAAVAAQDLLSPTPSLSNRMIGNSGPSLWYLLAMVPLGILVVLMGMRSHRVQQIRRTEQVKDENLHDLVFGSRRDRTRSESPDQLQQALTQIREKADTHGKQRSQQLANEALEPRDDLKQMIDLYLLYSQYQKALNVILTEITKRPGRADLRLYLMRVYAEMGDWKAFEEQEDVLRRLGQQQLLEQASQLRAQKGAP
jgi:pilus assembly protein FimV